MESKIIPDKLTKKMMFEMYKPMGEKLIRSVLNYYILELGKNVRIRILPDLVKLKFFITFGLPEGYILSVELQKKANKLNDIRTKKS